MRPFLESRNVENRTLDPSNTIVSRPRIDEIGLKCNRNIVAEAILGCIGYIWNKTSNRKSLSI